MFIASCSDVGHAQILEEAKKLGDYLVVGVHPDREVNRIKGSNYPIMNLHERVLSVLSCRVRDVEKAGDERVCVFYSLTALPRST